MNLTVTCLFVHGEYPYTAEYVTRLYAMVRRWLDRPFRFCCLTDQPWMFTPPIETIPIVKLAGFAPWTKLELFNPLREWKGRVLYLDLDSVLVAPLAEIVDVPGSFVITADPPRPGQKTRDSFGRAIVRRYNSSVMVWDGGTQTRLYLDWRPAVTQRLSGDQDWIGERTRATTLPREWFPRISEVSGPPFGPARIILCKVPKNDIAAQQYPWVAPLWGAA